ncbi:MAG: hypothetical protein EYC70_07585 [Planctomycetota bacterium]|nr:MAG: hypothetical protein EYC70_07585 [Planctomycetota bacterium]
MTCLPSVMALVVGASLVVLAGSVPAQTVGGGWDLKYRCDGNLPGDQYGRAVSAAGDVDGDGILDFAHGAPSADPGGLTDAGSVFVYSGATGGKLYRFDGPHAIACLGVSVASAGDVNGDGRADLIAGAPCADSPAGLNEGAAFVYSGVDGQVLYHFVGVNNLDGFGDSVDGGGDLNGDGMPDFLIGAPYSDVNGPSGGSVYVYSGADGSLLLQFHARGGSELGDSVGFIGDLNLDGRDDFIVSAPGAQAHGVMNSGSALVISGASGSIIYRIDNPIKGFLGRGDSVAGAGDCNGDSLPDMIVGAPFAEPNGVNLAGGVSVASGRTGLGLWARFGIADTVLGWSVSGAGDLDQDGMDDVVVSALGHGWVYLLRGLDGEEVWRFHIGSTRGENGAVAGLGDLDGDGFPDVIAGDGDLDPNGVTDGGSVLVYTHKPFLDCAPSFLSVAAGGPVDLMVDFPDSEAAQPYQILASRTGTGPTWLGGVQVPLTEDPIFVRSRDGTYPAYTTGFTGLLDAVGDAKAVLAPGAGQFAPHLIGHTLYFAAVTGLRAGAWSVSSMAAPLAIVP